MKRGGFSLLETMVTLFMIGIMLMLVSGLVKDLRQESINNLDHDQRMGAHQALDRIGLALRSCYRLDEPASGSSARLRMQSWNPDANLTRLPLPPAAPGGSPWLANDPAFLLSRTFEVTGGVLLCTNTRGSVSQSFRLLGNLAAFEATRQANGNCRLRLEWVDSRGRTRQLVRLSEAEAP
jgi:prepilin-type N-terminal cleavage/methylation domain-containing protein